MDLLEYSRNNIHLQMSCIMAKQESAVCFESGNANTSFVPAHVALTPCYILLACFLGLDSDGTWLFSSETLFCLTFSLRLMWAESRACGCWWCSWAGAWTPFPRITAGTKPDMTELGYRDSWHRKEQSFLLFQQVDSAVTSPTANQCGNMLWPLHQGRLRIH